MAHKAKATVKPAPSKQKHFSKNPVSRTGRRSDSNGSENSEIPSRRKRRVKTKPPVVVRVKSLEVQLLRRYLRMEGKIYKRTAVFLLQQRFAKAIQEGKVTDHLPLLHEINQHMQRALKRAGTGRSLKMAMQLNKETKAKALEVVKNLKVRARFEYLSGTEKK